MFVVVDCGFCMLCPCRKADDPPEQTMDPLPTLPDLKRLVFVKDCVCVDVHVCLVMFSAFSLLILVANTNKHWVGI